MTWVSAEKIETQRQLALLSKIGYDLAQRYLPGRPAALSDLDPIILRNFAEGRVCHPKPRAKALPEMCRFVLFLSRLPV